VDGVTIAFPHNHFFGHTVDAALIITANRAGEYDPIAFSMADAVVFDLFFEVRSLASHGMFSFRIQ
jgi:hypothetical protein